MGIHWKDKSVQFVLYKVPRIYGTPHALGYWKHVTPQISVMENDDYCTQLR